MKHGDLVTLREYLAADKWPQIDLEKEIAEETLLGNFADTKFQIHDWDEQFHMPKPLPQHLVVVSGDESIWCIDGDAYFQLSSRGATMFDSPSPIGNHFRGA